VARAPSLLTLAFRICGGRTFLSAQTRHLPFVILSAFFLAREDLCISNLLRMLKPPKPTALNSVEAWGLQAHE
jgi:hypothetical protein